MRADAPWSTDGSAAPEVGSAAFPASREPSAPEPAPKPGLGTLFTRVVADAGGLVLDEARLARAETQENIRGLGSAAAKLAIGALLIALALVFVTVAAVVALAALIGLLWALLAVTLMCIVGGWLFLQTGRSRMSTVTLLPERTLKRMASDLRWLADRSDQDATVPGKMEE